MCSERFYAEYFRLVVSTEQKIHAKFFRGNCRPVRCFTSDKRVNSFICDATNLRAGSPGHNADHTRLFRTEIKNFHRAIYGRAQFPNQFTARQRRADLQTDRLTFLLQEWLHGFQTERSSELCVVADFRMDIERQMRAVKRNVIFKCEPQLPSQRASYRLQSRPKQTVMHNQKIDVLVRGLAKHACRNINRRA